MIDLGKVQQELSKINLFSRYDAERGIIYILTKPSNKSSVGFITEDGNVNVYWNWAVNTNLPDTWLWDKVTVLSITGPVYHYESLEEFVEDVVFEPSVKKHVFLRNYRNEVTLSDSVKTFIENHIELIEDLDIVALQRAASSLNYCEKYQLKTALKNTLNIDILMS